MKGAIEYLRAVRDICTDKDCGECPLDGKVCPFYEYPSKWTDEDILRMVNAPERVKNGRI